MRPTESRAGLIALGAAWLVNAVALVVNQVLHHGAGVGPGPLIGVLALLIQALVLVAIARDIAGAVGIAVLFALLALFPLPILPRLLAGKDYWSAASLALSFALKAIGVLLLLLRRRLAPEGAGPGD